MFLPKFCIENRVVTYFALVLIVVVGIASYFRLGQLEDPDFTVKTAVIITQYPGASPEEVELEVTDRIETAVQELTELRFLTSFSHAGLSVVKVEIQQEYWADRLPQVWDQMRSKVRDIRDQLPPGVGKPVIMDDFSFVYGFVLAVTGDGFSYAELQEYVKAIRKELSLVDGVARVETWGSQPKVIYLDAAEERLLELGVSREDFVATLAQQNMVVEAGGLDVGGRRLRVAPTGEFSTPEDIGELKVRTSLLDKALDVRADLPDENRLPVRRSTDFLSLKDIVDIRQGYLEPPVNVMRFNGEPAIALSVANITGGNIVDTGRNLDAAVRAIEAELPVGIELHRVAWQSDLVTTAVNDFIINLVEAVLIVLVVLALAMGWRMGVIIGGSLALTILATFIFMAGQGIDLHRVSLGSLVIALGMMVDNAIVVADGMLVRMRKGMDRVSAAIEAATQPTWALMGATVVAVLAFYPIFASTTDGGEYGRSLFQVVGASLLFSWLIAMTITPLMCIDMLPDPEGAGEGDDDAQYRTPAFMAFRRTLVTALRLRWLTTGVMVGLLALSFYGFQFVERVFFTDATRAQFMIDVWAPEGTAIQQTGNIIAPLEDRLIADDRVAGVSSFMGSGGPRFYLPVDPEFPYASYAQIIVNTGSVDDVYTLIEDLEPWVDENISAQAMVRLRKYTAGPGFTWPFEARFSGPANADPQVLRDIGEQGMAILRASPHAKDIRTDMRERRAKVVPEYDQTTGVWTATSRNDIAFATQFAYDGVLVGLYREREDLLPIVLRRVQAERERVPGQLDLVQVRPSLSVKDIPLSAVTRDIRVEMEDPTIVRWNRRRAITVQASPEGVTLPTLREEVLDQFNAIELPPGYKLEWRGEHFSTIDSQDSLKPGAIPAFIMMVFIIVLLFNAIRPAIVIFLVVPFAFIGIAGGLLAAGQPFSFMALIGAMSLSGMMIKNSIVLIDEINLNQTLGKAPYDSVVDAAVSRLRPVALAALTTVLGVMPLVQDIFWVAMATTIAAGLTFGTILTMIMVPVLYAILHNVREDEVPQGRLVPA